MSGRKLAVITGATSGIGREFARRLAPDCNLIISGRREAKLRELAEELQAEHGGSVRVVIADLSEIEELDRLLTIISDAPALEYLVNNAGFGSFGGFAEVPCELHRTMLDVHCRAPMELICAALPKMKEAGRGNIINTSSIASFMPLPKSGIYSASKAFLRDLTETLAAEYGGVGIRFQALCPGMTRTDFHTRLGRPEDKVYRSRGLFRAQTSEEVVDYSLKCLKKDKVICIPGLGNRIIVWNMRHLPRPFVRRLMRKKLKQAEARRRAANHPESSR